MNCFKINGYQSSTLNVKIAIWDSMVYIDIEEWVGKIIFINYEIITEVKIISHSC